MKRRRDVKASTKGTHHRHRYHHRDTTTDSMHSLYCRGTDHTGWIKALLLKAKRMYRFDLEKFIAKFLKELKREPTLMELNEFEENNYLELTIPSDYQPSNELQGFKNSKPKIFTFKAENEEKKVVKPIEMDPREAIYLPDDNEEDELMIISIKQSQIKKMQKTYMIDLTLDEDEQFCKENEIK